MATKIKATSGTVSAPAKRVVGTTGATRTVARKPATKATGRAVRKPGVKPAAVAVQKPATKVMVAAPAPESGHKVKLVRDSFSFPAHEHALLAELKKRALKMGREFKKSEILRAGIAHLAAMTDNVLLTALSKVERVKTGRPSKKNKKK